MGRLRILRRSTAVCLAVVGSTIVTAPRVAAAPYQCALGDLEPSPFDIVVDGAFPEPLVVGEDAGLAVQVGLGPALFALPGLVGTVEDLGISLTVPGMDFTRGTAYLGDDPDDRQNGTVAVSDDTARVLVPGPAEISRSVALPPVFIELRGTPTTAGELVVDAQNVAVDFVLTPASTGTALPSTCEPTESSVVTSATVDEPEAPPPTAPDEGTPPGEPGIEQLPTTGPSTGTWVAIIAGIVALDAGWMLWSARRPGGRRRPAIHRGS